MNARQSVRPFSSQLPDVTTLRVVSRLQRSKGPTPEEKIESARQDAIHQGRLEGYMFGLNQGRRDGIEQGSAEAYAKVYQETKERCDRELEELFSILATHVAEVNAEIPKWFEHAEEQMSDRALVIVQRLLATELSLGRDHAIAIVKECLAEVTHSNHLKVRMNPFDAVVVSQHRDQLMALAPQLKDIVFVDDPAIEGGCVLESDGGAIDATLDTRLALVQGDLAA